MWKTRVEDSSGRLLSKTPFINIIKDAYGTLVWKTRVEDSSGRFVSKTPFIKIIKDYMEDSCGRLVWKSGMEYFYRRLLWHTYVHLL